MRPQIVPSDLPLPLLPFCLLPFSLFLFLFISGVNIQGNPKSMTRGKGGGGAMGTHVARQETPVTKTDCCLSNVLYKLSVLGNFFPLPLAIERMGEKSNRMQCAYTRICRQLLGPANKSIAICRVLGCRIRPCLYNSAIQQEQNIQME